MATQASETRQQGGGIQNLKLQQEHLKRLHEFHERFRKGQKGGKRTVLRNCDLSGLDFRGMDFSDAEFVGCNFANSDLRRSNFSGANIFGARFDEANLSNANFHRADLRGARMDGADLTETNLDRADLRDGLVQVSGVVVPEGTGGTSFKNATLRGTTMASTRLKSASFEGAFLENTDFKGADLRGATFKNSLINNAALEGAQLIDADFRGASIEGTSADLLVERMAQTSQLFDISPDELEQRMVEHLRWFESGGRLGRQISFGNFDLTGRDLSGLNFAAADLRNVVLVRANLSGAMLAAADLRGANLAMADLSNSDLRGADLSTAFLRETNLDGIKTGPLPGTDRVTPLPEGVRSAS